jgi:UDP-glucose 4-epimerase
MNILVTGGAGFIGSHVVDALVAEKHRVTVLDDLSSGNKHFLHPKATFVRGRIEMPSTAVLVKRLRPEAMYHFAAQKDARLSVTDPVRDARINVLGILQLVKGTMGRKLKRFVLASTGGAIYGGATTIPTPETYPAHPLSPYGVSKLASEHYLNAYREVGGLPFVSLRFANVYGPRQNPKSEAGVIAIFIRALLRRERPTLFGDGKQTRDYVYVADVVRASVAALTTKHLGIYNIGTGVETSLQEVYGKLQTLIGTSLSPKRGPGQKGEERRSAIAIEKAREFLNWEPEIFLDEGLRKTIAWQRAQKDL